LLYTRFETLFPELKCLLMASNSNMISMSQVCKSKLADRALLWKSVCFKRRYILLCSVKCRFSQDQRGPEPRGGSAGRGRADPGLALQKLPAHRPAAVCAGHFRHRSLLWARHQARQARNEKSIIIYLYTQCWNITFCTRYLPSLLFFFGYDGHIINYIQQEKLLPDRLYSSGRIILRFKWFI